MCVGGVLLNNEMTARGEKFKPSHLNKTDSYAVESQVVRNGTKLQNQANGEVRYPVPPPPWYAAGDFTNEPPTSFLSNPNENWNLKGEREKKSKTNVKGWWNQLRILSLTRVIAAYSALQVDIQYQQGYLGSPRLKKLLDL